MREIIKMTILILYKFSMSSFCQTSIWQLLKKCLYLIATVDNASLTVLRVLVSFNHDILLYSNRDIYYSIISLAEENNVLFYQMRSDEDGWLYDPMIINGQGKDFVLLEGSNYKTYYTVLGEKFIFRIIFKEI